ncbi:MAG: D-alanyl-D-alanine carboxypeptidase/D-alanyl-D-alanine-endopeptidase [Proteobacteria bacterium]|jgi:serine-type D-Ala-D-Ala carboxypeptidase/endopeptidase (penicillin-binding protein 4)|nr:D-alanyl-D-alanine carboxypeptidase/D-alanyl-D-alanine-endopeptidase [Pseudomonadota bacterium]
MIRHCILCWQAVALLFLLSTPVFAAPEIDATLTENLTELLADRALKNARVGLEVRNVESGEAIFAHHADVALVPASTMKVVTAAAALNNLGPSYTFSTVVHSGGVIDSAGRLKGNLYVQGHGDPTMVVEKLWKLVYDLKLAGLQRVEGDVIFDEGFLTTDYVLPGWNKEKDIENGPSYFPALSALSLNFNTVAIIVAPGSEVGKPARVQLETPAGTYVTLNNEVTTGSYGSRRALEIKRNVGESTISYTVTGSMPTGAKMRKYYRAVADPTAHFMAAWEEMEKLHGIVVTGRHRRGATPNDARQLLALQSPPLASILMDMNKYSNNYMAELVLRTLGAETHGLPGDTAKGIQAVNTYLMGLGIDETEFNLINGSGLTRQATIRPSHLNEVLLGMSADPRTGNEFRASLAIAGQDGTLVNRLTGQPGTLRGKTGTIDGVHCLTGYVEDASGDLYAFSFMVNDIRGSVSQVRRVHDRFARVMLAAGQPGLAVVEGGPE